MLKSLKTKKTMSNDADTDPVQALADLEERTKEWDAERRGLIKWLYSEKLKEEQKKLFQDGRREGQRSVLSTDMSEAERLRESAVNPDPPPLIATTLSDQDPMKGWENHIRKMEWLDKGAVERVIQNELWIRRTKLCEGRRSKRSGRGSLVKRERRRRIFRRKAITRESPKRVLLRWRHRRGRSEISCRKSRTRMRSGRPA